MKTTRFIAIALFFFLFASSFAITAQTITVRDIMAEPSIVGMRPEGEKLSPNGRMLAFFWNAEGKMPRDLYIVSTADGVPRKLLSPRDLPAPSPSPSPTPENKLNYGVEMQDEFVRSRQNQIGSVEWSPDSRKLIFSHSGDVYVLSLDSEKPKRFTKTQTPEFGARFLDNNRILYMQGGNVFVLDTANSTITQISREANPQSFISVGNVSPNESGSLIAYAVSDGSKQRALVVPNYLGEFTSAPSVRRGWSEQKVMVLPTDGSRDRPFEIKLPKADGVSNLRRMEWAADGKSLIIDRVDKDTKRRQLFYVHNAGGKGEQLILVTEETDEKWQATLSAIYEPDPKNAGRLFFGSERDGYNHLYLATLEPLKPESNATAEIRGEGDPGYSSNVKIEQLTQGNWQVEWAKWLPNGQIVYSSTENSVREREFYVLDPASKNHKLFATGDGAMKTGAQLSDESEIPVLIFSSSKWNTPADVFSTVVCDGCESKNAVARLTETVPSRIPRVDWVPPQFVDIPSRDGKKVPARYYLPAGFNKKQKYPMVIFVHGAGYLQNVINGWNNYYREFMFNEMLTRMGYVVLDIDYRGSAGYGRDWRTDVYDFLGGTDFDDHLDAIDFMVANHSVDPKRVGAYGGSYGGFMAGMLSTRAPERIAAAAALRPVFDWKNYYASSPGYTAQRLGFPDKNPEAYKRSSPITYAEKLERPLLILHGMSDDNVHVQDSVQMMEKLVRLGKTKYFEAMLYPSENHGFVRPESWTDEYERILAFFEKHLK